MMEMGVLDTMIRFLAVSNPPTKDPNTSWKAVQSILNFIEGGDSVSSNAPYPNIFVSHIRSKEWMLHAFAENIIGIDASLQSGSHLEGGKFAVTMTSALVTGNSSDLFDGKEVSSNTVILTAKQLTNIKKTRDALNLILTKWFTSWWNRRINNPSVGLDELVNSLENVQLD